MDKREGFTLIELLIATLILGIILGVVFNILIQNQKSARTNELLAEAQQNARVAMDMIASDLRMAGYNIVEGEHQVAICYADSFTVIFNADLYPDTAMLPPPASGPKPKGSGIGSGYTYTPPSLSKKDAETIRYSFDFDNDASFADDTSAVYQGENLPKLTANPNDMILVKQIFKSVGSANVMDTIPVAFLRGPVGGGSYKPVFTYLLNTDSDKELEDTTSGPITGQGRLNQIEKIIITVVGEAPSPDPNYKENNGYRRVTMTTEVNVMRNVPGGVRYITGWVFEDRNADKKPDPGDFFPVNAKLTINELGTQRKTDEAGHYDFLVEPDTHYTVTLADPSPGFHSVSTDTDTVVDVSVFSADSINFLVEADSMGLINGRVFFDSIIPYCFYNPPEDTPLPNVKVHAYKNVITDTSGYYEQEAPAGVHLIVQVFPPPNFWAKNCKSSYDTIIHHDGDTVTVDFGLCYGESLGTIEGKVFLDYDEDTVFDEGSDSLLGGVRVYVTKDEPPYSLLEGEAHTNEIGYYFIKVQATDADTYAVFEEPGGYRCISPNPETGVWVKADSFYTVNFANTKFKKEEVAAGGLPYEIITPDLSDGNNPTDTCDIVVGGFDSLYVWYTFPTDATPGLCLVYPDSIFTLASDTLDEGKHFDLVSGHSSDTFRVWIAEHTTGSNYILPITPDTAYSTSGAVISSGLADLSISGGAGPDLVVGTMVDSDTGTFEVWKNKGEISNKWQGFELDSVYAGVGEVRGLGVADLLDSDTDMDIVIGTKDDSLKGKLMIYRNNGSGKYSLAREDTISGEVNCLVICDVKEDTNNDLDIIFGTRSSYDPLKGSIEIWCYNTDSSRYVRRSRVDTEGEVLAIDAGFVDSDTTNPEVVVGIRTDTTNQEGGTRIYYLYNGYLPLYGSDPSYGVDTWHVTGLSVVNCPWGIVVVSMDNAGNGKVIRYKP